MIVATAASCTRADGAATSRRIGTPTSTTAGPRPARVTTRPESSRPQRITIIGDSLVVQASDALRFAAQHESLDLNALNGTTVADWTPLVASIVARSQPDVLVIALGTNDNLKGVEANRIGPSGAEVSYRTRLEQLLRAAADAPCLIWVEPSGQGFTGSYQLNAFANNRVLSSVLAEQRVAAASWDARQTASGGYRNGWNTIDTIHLTDLGETVYARLILDAVADSCPPE